MVRFSVRSAVADDADAIVRIHHAAVYDTARAFYPPEILDAWAVQLIEESCQTVRREIADPATADIAGFGMVVPAHEELRAVYVHPQFGRQGAGSAILQRLEELASARGVISLHLDSSINAEAFYARHGYGVVERGMHRFQSGIEMACVRMWKDLVP